jgi:putative transposase
VAVHLINFAEWRWSSVHTHLAAAEDGITALAPVLERYSRFADRIENGPDPDAFAHLRRAESIGRPLGDDRFINRLEALTRRSLRPRKPGPEPSSMPET